MSGASLGPRPLWRRPDPGQPLPVIGIAVGPKADRAALDTVATVTKATGGRVFVARDDVSAIQPAIRQIVLAFAGRISDS